jgi:hypothetical protein
VIDAILSDELEARQALVRFVTAYCTTSGGRLRGFLIGVSESPAVIVGRERHLGLVAVQDALGRILHDM